MPSSVANTFARSGGLLTAQSFWGARRMRAPLAPPRLSVPRNVEADAHAVETSCEMERPEASILTFKSAMSFASTSSWVSGGTGSCHSCGSAGTSGPRYRERGPMSRCVSLNHALARDSADQVVMVVTDAILVARRRPCRLDAPDEAFGHEHSERVVHRLERDRADLRPGDVGDLVCRDVRPSRDRAHDRQSLRRHLDTVSPKEIDRVARHRPTL
jgi:hypothetical protein